MNTSHESEVRFSLEDHKNSLESRNKPAPFIDLHGALYSSISQSIDIESRSPMTIRNSPTFDRGTHGTLSVQSLLASDKGTSKYLKLLQKTNKCFEEIIDVVKCYRPEMGRTLEKVLENYNKILSAVVHSCQDSKNKLDNMIDNIKTKHTETLQNETLERDFLIEKLRSKNKKIAVLESQLRIAKMTEESLTRDVNQMREIMKFDRERAETFKQELMHKEEIEEDIEGEEIEAGKKYEFKPKHAGELKDIAENSDLKNQLDDLQGIMDMIEAEHLDKSELIQNMNEVLITMGKARSASDKSCQVGDGMLYWDWYPVAFNPPPNNPSSYFCIFNTYHSKLRPNTNAREGDASKWCLTPVLMNFLSNTPERLVGHWDYKDLKLSIIDICKARMVIHPELTAYDLPRVHLDEFICTYSLMKRSHRRLAEIRVKEFLTSLRCHMERYLGPRLFSAVAGLTGNKLDNADFIMSDYYTQMYYVYCMNLLLTDTDSYVQTAEGNFWIKPDREELVSNAVLPWVKKKEMMKFRADLMRRNYKKNPDHLDGPHIELDNLMDVYVNSFIVARNSNLDKLTKSFVRRNSLQEGLFTFDEYVDTIKEALTQPNEELVFPSSSTIGRSFCLGLSLGSNLYEINKNNFLAACIRLGFDNPFPLVQADAETIYPLSYLKTLTQPKEESKAPRPGPHSARSKPEKASLCDKGAAYIIIRKENAISESSELMTIGHGLTLEKTAAMMAQHVSILRELKQYSDEFKARSESTSEVLSLRDLVKELCIVIDEACEFFTYPVTF